MKKIGLLTTAILFSGFAFAQTSNNENHGATVSTVAKSETKIGSNKGEVSSTASVNSHSSVKVAKPHTSDNVDERRERKEAAAAKRAEAKAEFEGRIEAKKEAVDAHRNEVKENVEAKREAIAEHKAEVQAIAKKHAEAGVDASANAVNNVSGSTSANLNKAKAIRIEGSVNSATKMQLRRSSVTGNFGGVTRLHL